MPGDGTGKRSGVFGPVNLGAGSEDGVRGVVGPPNGVPGPDNRLPSPTLVSPSGDIISESRRLVFGCF